MIIEQINRIALFMGESFLHIWPYLLITIPIAVAVNMSGASKYIEKAFRNRPVIAIVLATVVGAFSPFCSCGVIPVVAALLIGGVPLAPVMSFWIASPSMDPEIFFLSVGMLGWKLAIWRMTGTLVVSLGAGFATHFLQQQGWLGVNILRTKNTGKTWNLSTRLQDSLSRFRTTFTVSPRLGFVPASANTDNAAEGTCCLPSPATTQACDCGATTPDSKFGSDAVRSQREKPAFARRLLSETWSSTLMVGKFMALAFFLQALIAFYVPEELISEMLGSQNPWSIVMATALGIPAYTSNLTALPLVSGLIAQGMNPAAGLSFLLSGATTTLPAMAAVWGLVEKRIFALYLSFALLGGLGAGYAFSAAELLF